MGAGAPTKYKEEYCKKIIEFFSVEHIIEKKRTKINKDGSIHTWTEEVANSLPTFEGFAARVCGVCVDTLHEWKKKKDEKGNLVYPEFSEAYKRCKNLQKEMLNDLGMKGLYNAAYTKFVAINITDMRDVQHIEQKTNELRQTAVVTKEELKAEEKRINKEFESG